LKVLDISWIGESFSLFARGFLIQPGLLERSIFVDSRLTDRLIIMMENLEQEELRFITEVKNWLRNQKLMIVVATIKANAYLNFS
jgi:hypothetical protein